MCSSACRDHALPCPCPAGMGGRAAGCILLQETSRLSGHDVSSLLQR